MPPRKSSDAAPLPARTRLVDKAPSASASVDGLPGSSGSSASSGTGGSKEGREKEREREYVTIEDLALPKSIITRLAKGVLPPNAQIQATAALAMSKSATVFINYLAAHANERTINANKKTILPADVFQALDDIQFSFFKEPLEAEFAKYHQIRSDKRTDYRRRTKSSKLDPDPNTNSNNPDGDTSTTNPPTPSDRDAGPRSKKARMESQHEGDVEADLTEEERDAAQDDEEDHDVEEEQPEEQDEEGGEEVEDELDELEEEEGEDTGAPVDEMQDVVEEEEALVMEERDEALEGDESD